jgi:hypothetical protein
VAHLGKLRVALYTIKAVELGSVLSYDYHCNTDDINEYRNSKCLCGAQSCSSLYLSLTASHFDAILQEHHSALNRLAMIARACEQYSVKSSNLSKRDAATLASVGFGTKLFRESPGWLKCFCAQVIEFIKFERSELPQYLVAKVPSIYSDLKVAQIEADGVYGLRLQNLAITVDRVLGFLRRHPDHLVPPLYPYTDAEAARKLVFGDRSIWSTLRNFVSLRERTFQSSRLKESMEGILKRWGNSKHSLAAARQILLDTAACFRDASKAYSPAADVLEVSKPLHLD